MNEIIDSKFVLFQVPGATQREVIEKIVETAASLGRVSSVNDVVEAVLFRETEGSTGFGSGIAIPHGKSSHVIEPTLMCAKLAQPVAWQAMDEAPVTFLFMILVPEESHTEHLQLLAKLARKLMHAEFVDQLMSVQTPDNMVNFLKVELELRMTS